MHGRIENGQMVEYPIYDLNSRLGYFNLPNDLTKNENLPEGFVYVKIHDHILIDPATQRLEYDTPYLLDGQWHGPWKVVELTESEQEAKRLQQAEFMRQQRNYLIEKSDWTQLPDSPVDKNLWATYRQALRDIPSQPGFPFNIEWPVAPT